MPDMLEKLPGSDWIDEQAARIPDAEHSDDVRAIKNRREDGRKAEAQLRDVLSILKIKSADLDSQNSEASVAADAMAQAAEDALATPDGVEDTAIYEQATIDANVVPSTVTGSGPGHYYDFNPYSYWHRWYTHNEGGFTEGRVACNLSARRMHAYSRARGDGIGITDDNYTTSWVKMYFALWPRQNGHVRAFVPYTTRGYYQIYSNDHWYDSKRAIIDVDMHVQLYQNYWGGYVRDDLFRLNSQNINRNGRIDTSRTMYSGGLPIAADRWVIAEVALKAYAYTSGGGSSALASFWGNDYVYVPYVRFDFS